MGSQQSKNDGGCNYEKDSHVDFCPALTKCLSIKNSKIIFVSGFAGPKGGDKTDIQRNCWRLHSYIYDISERKMTNELEKLEFVINKSATLDTVNGNNVKELQEKLFGMPLNDPGITLVVFGHSHGAKVVYEALKEKVFSLFLASRGIRDAERRSARIKQIRAHLAVITLGGIQLIPRSCAAICHNVRFKDDGVAKIGLKLCQEEHGEETEIEDVGRTGSTLLDSVSGLAFDGFALSAKAAVKLKKIADGFDDVYSPMGVPLKSAATVSAGASAASAASAASGKHFMTEYLESERIKKKILMILGINDDVEEGNINSSSASVGSDDFVDICDEEDELLEN